ncbi:MAG TPA: sigma-70 family RNA polymerase sigma factor, partial [Pirellulales bacterium]|nr:sigma-70 family RNA polymerase sigma factor [Pirellulales bacterium]
MDDVASEHDCLLKVRSGDEVAAAELVERLYPLAAKIVRSYLPRGWAEEDLLQEVFLRVFARLDQYRADAPLEHWVSRLAVRVCIDALRSAPRRGRELRWSDLDEREAALVRETTGPTQGASPLNALAARELVDKMLDVLTPEDRVILTMLDIEQYSVADVARLTGRTKTSVKVRALRARRKMRGVLARLLEEE